MARIKLAIQKSGRLTDKSLSILEKAGIEFNSSKDNLYRVGRNFPIDIMMVRDDDIPEYVVDGVCDIGIVGQNVLIEKLLSKNKELETCYQFGFGQCRLSLAISESDVYKGAEQFQNSKIATSYPEITSKWLKDNNVNAEVVEISGSVEIAPKLGVADFVCDLVSTGSTLRQNGLKEAQSILQSQSVMVKANDLTSEKIEIIDRLLARFKGVQKASENKYIMLNCDRQQLPQIKDILPGMESPSIMNLDEQSDRLAVHVVCQEDIFWETIENLKAAGASSILVLPIEKIM